MRAVVQRVTRAAVRVDARITGEVGRGLLVLVGVGVDDEAGDASALAAKIAGLRIFDDAQGQMNLALAQAGGGVLVVSQFTLHGDARSGRRPSFSGAARGAHARTLYEAVVQELRGAGVPVQTGEFGATMEVELVNDGPVTILLDTKRVF